MCKLCSRKTKATEVINGYEVCPSCIKAYFRKCHVCNEYHHKRLSYRVINYFRGSRYKMMFRKIYKDKRVDEHMLICHHCFHKYEEEYFGGKAAVKCTCCSHYANSDDIRTIEISTPGSDFVAKKQLCKICQEKLKECECCGSLTERPLKTDVDGKFVCKVCANEHKEWIQCANCGNQHHIDYTKRLYDTRYTLCDKCYPKARICDKCNGIRKIASMRAAMNAHLCADCYRLCGCGEPIISQSTRSPETGKTVCVQCAAKLNVGSEGPWDYAPSRFYYYQSGKDNLKKDDLYLGFENEEMADKSNKINKMLHLASIQKHYNQRDLYAVFDGSIGGQEDLHGSTGFELVSHPRTLLSHKEMDWSKMFTKHTIKHDTCGMHVHLSRSSFKGKHHLYKLMKFIYTNNAFINKIAERKSNSYTSSIPIKHVKGEAMKGYKRKSNAARRVKVNLCNKHTIELRFFANANDAQSLYKNLEFSHALFYFAKEIEVARCTKYSLFLEYVKENKELYNNLYRFLVISKLISS